MLIAGGLSSFVTSLLSTSCMGNVFGTGTALSVGIEPTSTTQYRRLISTAFVLEYKVVLLSLMLASINDFSGSFAMLQRSTLVLLWQVLRTLH